MSDWTKEGTEAARYAVFLMFAKAIDEMVELGLTPSSDDAALSVAIELAYQRNALLDAATKVASWVDGLTCGDPRFQPDIDALNAAIARTKGKL